MTILKALKQENKNVTLALSFSDKVAKIGSTTKIVKNNLTIEVTIKDYRFSYGNDHWLVTPKSGSGEVWVENITF